MILRHILFYKSTFVLPSSLIEEESTVLTMNIRTPKIRGKNEAEMYKNFIQDCPRIEQIMQIYFDARLTEKKDNAKSQSLRHTANNAYLKNGETPAKVIKMYTNCLRFAIYKSEDYAIAIANRSAVLFTMFKFEECIEDINLSLKAEYPNYLRPKVYLRKCSSYQKLGDRENMIKSGDEYRLFLKNCKLPSDTVEKFKKELEELLAKDDIKVSGSEPPVKLSEIKKNETFSDASVDVALKQCDGEFYVSSCRKFKKGEVLFEEKAYGFSVQEEHERKFCEFCCKVIFNGIPCKNCVEYVFCSEKCRNSAWNQFHQWECFVVRVNLLYDQRHMRLALRVILKAFHQEVVIPPSRKDVAHDKYAALYHLSSNFGNQELLQLTVENTVLLVNFLNMKTDFFEHVKRQINFSNKSVGELMTMIGSLIIRHAMQIQRKGLFIIDFFNLDKFQRVSALAICPSAAQMTHACEPNTFHYFHDNTITVRALTDIEANTKLTYSYRDLSFFSIPLQDRTKILWDLCGIKCKCKRCSDPILNLEKLDSYFCIRCNGPAIPTKASLPDQKYKCLQCKNTFVMPLAIKNRIFSARTNFYNFFQSNNIKLAEAGLATCKTFLSPYHQYLEEIYRKMFHYYILHNEIISALKISKVFIDYHEMRGGSIIEDAVNQILFCEVVFECVGKDRNTLPIDVVINALNHVKEASEKAEKLCEELYPQLLKKINIIKLQHSCLMILKTANI